MASSCHSPLPLIDFIYSGETSNILTCSSVFLVEKRKRILHRAFIITVSLAVADILSAATLPLGKPITI